MNKSEVFVRVDSATQGALYEYLDFGNKDVWAIGHAQGTRWFNPALGYRPRCEKAIMQHVEGKRMAKIIVGSPFGIVKGIIMRDEHEDSALY